YLSLITSNRARWGQLGAYIISENSASSQRLFGQTKGLELGGGAAGFRARKELERLRGWSVRAGWYQALRSAPV
ncbi:hypothetical protein, partial [Mesorhizobium sp.]|uniref:hypothetical protein n=1 Tax=Mesorhizobium sp. TaxID=1871066 RepID=UPI0025C6186B